MKLYLQAIENTFGGSIDYAMLIKMFGSEPDDQRRYSPPKCTGMTTIRISGQPDPNHISTSYAEWSNLTIRMGMRRFVRLTNAFSKKMENHRHAVALNFFYYNFCRVHMTLKTTPAIAAGMRTRSGRWPIWWICWRRKKSTLRAVVGSTGEAGLVKVNHYRGAAALDTTAAKRVDFRCSRHWEDDWRSALTQGRHCQEE